MTTQWQESESRQEKVMAAKAAFGSRDVRAGVSEETRTAYGWRLWRFMASAMLLLLLLAAFTTGFSYHGFDREYVREKLQEDTTWQQIEQKVQDAYVSIRQWSP